MASVVWDLPAGAGRAQQPHGVLGALANDWTVTTLVTLQSGVPVAVTQTTNFNAFAGFGVQRPESGRRSDAARGSAHAGALVRHGGVRRRAAVHDRIGVAQPGARAVVSRRRSRGDAPHSGRRRSARSSCAREVFNLFNTVNFGAPNAVVGAANFGTITSALDPRVVQLALKLLF